MSDDAEFPKTTYRLDPYRNFKFRVKWEGAYVAGVSKVSGLKRTTEVIRHRSGGDPGVVRRSPGQNEYHPISLERGVTYDAAFEQWANKVWDYHNSTSFEAGNHDVALRDFRKDIVLELFNAAGQKVLAYNVYNCWPSEYLAMPELDGAGDAVVIQSLTLENEGWERDMSVQAPTEPSFTLPKS